MDIRADRQVIAFAGASRIAEGELSMVAASVKRALDGGEQRPVSILDRITSEHVELDLRGTVDEVVARLEPPQCDGTDDTAAELALAAEGSLPQPQPRGPGRPRLGVVAKEVTLLPRHWEWLAAQQGGASVTLRKLVEQARKQGAAQEAARLAQDRTYKFMINVAGNEPEFEEVSRALYAGDIQRFRELTESWHPDVRDHARELAARSVEVDPA